MNITVTARHCSVPATVRSRTTERLERLAQLDHRITGAGVVFDLEHGQRAVEVQVSRAHGAPALAHATGPTFRAAFARAASRLERQVKRERDRLVRRRTRGPRKSVRPLEEPPAP